VQIEKLKIFLDAKVDYYNQPLFIEKDPISVPHQFSKKQDIEIAALFAATFAWGNRTTIINKAKELMTLMDDAPHQFITQHKAADLKPFLNFKHRTFNADDAIYFIYFLQQHYLKSESLETAFFPNKKTDVAAGLNHFKQQFFQYPHLQRTQKHVSAPKQQSACKRLNMFLRWMVRKDTAGVDFGIWKNIKMNQLICPLDVHVSNIARQLGLLHNKNNNWDAAIELTANLQLMNAADPVIYDYALFSMGEEKSILTSPPKLL
jgi:uncharacterized protein (TIGR02757 family)